MRDPQDNVRPAWRADRRQLLTLGLGTFVVASLPLALSRRRVGEVVRRQVPVMGTLADLTVVTEGRRRGHAALDEAVAALRAVDRTMTVYAGTSDVGRANARAARDAVVVDEATATVVREALGWAEATDGRFDPCLGRATRLWDVKERRTPPAAAAVDALASRALWRHLDVGTLDGRPCLRYEDPDVGVDLGGIAKGFAVDQAVLAVRRAGVESALLNVGGDLVALGRSPDGDPWQVGIRSPEDARALLTTLDVEDEAIATSGDYEQAFLHGGRRYHHLLDGATAAPRATLARSLTVAAPTCMEADAAATAAFGLTEADAGALLQRVGAGARVIRVA